MTNALVQLLAWPMSVLRLLRALVWRLVRFGRSGAARQGRIRSELRRRYPDAPDAWLELVERTTPTAMGPEPDPLPHIEQFDGDIPGPIPNPEAPWRQEPAAYDVQTVGAPAVSGPAMTRREAWLAAEPRRATRRGPAWRQARIAEPAATAWVQPGTSAAALPEPGPARPSPAIVQPRSEYEAKWPELMDGPALMVLEAPVQGAPGPTSSQRGHWRAPPAEATGEQALWSAASWPHEGSGWQVDTAAEHWPALLPNGPRRSPDRSTSFDDRVARLRVIQSRL